MQEIKTALQMFVEGYVIGNDGAQVDQVHFVLLLKDADLVYEARIISNIRGLILGY